METPKNELESLEIIRSMIRYSKRNLREQSIFYLIWGWGVLAAAAGQYLLLTLWNSQWHWVTWPVALFWAGILSMVTSRRLSRSRKATSFVENSMGYLWGGFIIYILILLAISARIGWTYSYLLIIGLYGLATFISGGILRFRPLLVGGVLSLLLALGGILGEELYHSFPNVLLLLCASIIVSYLIPGYMLRAEKS